MQKKFFYLVASVMILFSSCEDKETIDNSNITVLGKWVNTCNFNDSISFISKDTLKRGYHIYTYKVTNDSISINYKGPDKIYVKPTTHKLNINNTEGILQISDLDKTYPKGDTGISKYTNKIISTLPTNQYLIGNWIDKSKSTDTIKFLAVDNIVRPILWTTYYINNWYHYSVNVDTLIIQYNGPDKIYTLPTKNIYRLDRLLNELTINYSKLYPENNFRKVTYKKQ